MAALSDPKQISIPLHVISPQNIVHLRGGGKIIGRNATFHSNSNSMSRSESSTLERTDTIRTIGKLKMRGKTDDLPQDWWFASTAIPLLAATIGPLANVLSIAALVSKWRVALPNNGQLPDGTDDAGVDIPDPEWEVIWNAFSLGFGFFGNFCLLLNFTKRVRYIIALPATILSWYFATGILMGIIIAMDVHVPPVRPGETYSQGFWYAVEAAVLYLVGSVILMINMTGYFLGHYPQHFDLDDDQRTLILQTMMFFFWLAGGAAVFSKVCGFSYADALYFCDVTVLTIGFGDFTSHNDVGRGLVFPYAVIGIIFLGLMINSIRKFALGMSQDKIFKKHQLQERERTFGRTVTSENELRDRLGLPPRKESVPRRKQSNTRRQSVANSTNWPARRSSLDQYGRFDMKGRTITFHEKKFHNGGGRGGAGRGRSHKSKGPKAPLSRDAKMKQRKEGQTAEAKRARRREKLVLLTEEKDRFEAMREIQSNTHKFEQYWALATSAFAFSILWCVGAAIFYIAEKRIQDLSYFDTLYFCYVSLLTIGYGDFSPKSNAGKPFFVVWSLIAIPTMTILISNMSETVVTAINHGTFKVADWTVMPKEGVWHDFLETHPMLKEWINQKEKERQAKKRIEQGFELQNPDEETAISGEEVLDQPPTLEKLAEETPENTEHELARLLAQAIKRVAHDLHDDQPKRYSYEEWVEFTRLIRFSSKKAEEVEAEEDEEGLVEWDWIGEDSPMLADVSESEWVLDRLCESLNRYTRRRAIERRKRSVSKARDLDDYDVKAPAHKRLSYPPHPGFRFPHDHRGSSVLSRGSSGDEIKPLHSSQRSKGKEREFAIIEGQSLDISASGESSGTTITNNEFEDATEEEAEAAVKEPVEKEEVDDSLEEKLES
ncbi:hypothetical protein G7Y89_g3044 [Cudoniella acicularis]|uniref:Potassium channel domain-containing protein n=1 Tax=Cudoniella acicularis TaxID=354080 RepID=A0A8H4W5Y4_9HELO|nr:hypothetical protein G7Y89_g3044 [Cudoniella acicularis]